MRSSSTLSAMCAVVAVTSRCSGSRGQPLRDLADEAPRERELVHPRQRMRAGVVEQRDLVVIPAERVLRAIGDDQRELLSAPLLLGM
jgi:hypothetical protein